MPSWPSWPPGRRRFRTSSNDLRVTLAPLVAVRGLSKQYGSVRALQDVAFELFPGRVSAIVGENGAGKSTLARILAGVAAPDAGEIRVAGTPVRFRGRRDAIAAGIGFVPQALSFIATLSVADNHRLGGSGLIGRRGPARRALDAALVSLGLQLDCDRPVERLSLAERQLGEIAAAVADGARVLLLDEPTSTLGPAEIARLIAAIRRLAAGGTAIALVTHRVREVLEAADTVTVLRGGARVFDGATAGLDAAAVSSLMVGERRHGRPALPEVVSDRTRLEVRDLSVVEDGQTMIERVSFAVRQGEILGVAGVSGAAQPALAEAVAGLRAPRSGRVLIDGADVTGDPARAARSGLAYVPEDRSLGLGPDLPVATNASLLRLREPAFRRFWLRRRAAEAALGERVVAAFDVRPARTSVRAGGLSGGNQQKLLVGRELEREPCVVVVHGPTQGLDLAAASVIRDALAAAARRGAAVLVISADLDEIFELSHCLIVIAGGRITDCMVLDGKPDMARIGAAMADATVEQAG